MKALLIAGMAATALCVAHARAADIPAKAPVRTQVVAPLGDWTGFYAGIYAGGGVNQSSATSDDVVIGTSVDINGTGHTGGVQAGYNWQVSRHWVIGVEGDIGWLGIDRSFTDWGDPFFFNVKTGAYGTLRGRAGYSTGPSLLYATAGAAFINVKDRFGPTGTVVTHSKTVNGWTAGGGIETMLARNWSAKVEYLYIDAGDRSFASGTDIAYFDNRFHVIKVGLNYQFGGGPAIAGPGAAGLPVKAPVAASHGSWTGFYTGLNAGIGIAHSKGDEGCCTGSVDINDSGFTGGVQAGYNVQLGPRWVAGIEGDIGWLGISHSLWPLNESPSRFGIKTDAYGTLRGRFGYSTGPSLLYATVGAAIVRVENIFGSPGGTGAVFTNSKTATGWTAGGGIETVLAANWSAKTEYLYIDAGGQTVTDPTDPMTLRFEKNRFHVVKFGLNYKFGDIGKAPIAAKY
ncbi:MAG: outer membrane protein [Xanthobacteraceae bacterium]